jgi:hypothetical protein
LDLLVTPAVVLLESVYGSPEWPTKPMQLAPQSIAIQQNLLRPDGGLSVKDFTLCHGSGLSNGCASHKLPKAQNLSPVSALIHGTRGRPSADRFLPKLKRQDAAIDASSPAGAC